jgi:hypothetical protein
MRILGHEETVRLFLQGKDIRGIQRINLSLVSKSMGVIDIKHGLPIDIGNSLDVIDPCGSIEYGHETVLVCDGIVLDRIITGAVTQKQPYHARPSGLTHQLPGFWS